MDVVYPHSPADQPAEVNVGPRTEKTGDGVESVAMEVEEGPILDYTHDNREELKPFEPPVDWFEPLEDDEEGSLGGESEISVNVGTSEKKLKRVLNFHLPRGRKSHPDEGWEDWTALGEGWKRKEVVRRSGSSVGQKDVYYLSPRGDRVRSRVELVSVLEGILEMSQFDYKSGVFLDGQAPKRRRPKKKVVASSSSESSWSERGDGADTPDSVHRLTPILTPKNSQPNQTFLVLQRKPEIKPEPNRDFIKLPLPSASRNFPLPAINGEAGSQESILECSRCGISFTGTQYDMKRKKPCCASCWASKTKEHPMIRFRKWIPCGQCMGCLTTLNCGQCANCKNGFQGTDLRKRICRKRRCSCPIRKDLGVKKTETEDVVTTEDAATTEAFEDVSDQNQPTSPLKGSDTENLSVNMDDDDDDLSTDDDDDWHKKRKRRACGECKACVCRRDCGSCDFCVDKPKFGGSNKKRQKCRLRQCQRQAMRHLLPAEMEVEGGVEHLSLPGRPRPHYTYSRKTSAKKNKSTDLSDNEDDNVAFPANYWTLDSGSNDLKCKMSMEVNHSEIKELNGVDEIFSLNQKKTDPTRPRDDGKFSNLKDDPKSVFSEKQAKDKEEFPTITHIFSLASRSNGVGEENQLEKLLKSLQEADLPLLWYVIMVDGPLLQLIQCSKRSSMADTTVLIDPSCGFQVSVQRQPLLPSHWLYDDFPAPLSTVARVLRLLGALERCAVCHGLPPKVATSGRQVVTLERAATCLFLVKRNVSVCSNCKLLCK